jgi:hypothetical protein
MACPYFYPVSHPLPPLESLPLPLGDGWSGLCHAPNGPPVEPDQAQLVALCHLGYVRGRCRHFPKDDTGADAVRFAVSADSGTAVDLDYVLERDHHPFAHGSMSYSLPLRRFLSTGALSQPGARILARQAEAYVESYLRRQKEAARL